MWLDGDVRLNPAKIRAYREARGITQGGLADLAGLTVWTINRHERAELPARVDTARRIADVLEVDITDIVSDELLETIGQEQYKVTYPTDA